MKLGLEGVKLRRVGRGAASLGLLHLRAPVAQVPEAVVRLLEREESGLLAAEPLAQAGRLEAARVHGEEGGRVLLPLHVREERALGHVPVEEVPEGMLPRYLQSLQSQE